MTQTGFDLLAKGGVLMLPIAACSVVAVALLVDRAIFLLATRDPRIDPRAFDGGVRDGAHPALRTLSRSRGAVAALWVAAVRAIPNGRDGVERAVQIEGTRQIARAERGLSVLGAVVAVTPMLGFLGTIIGLIDAFMEWEQLGADVEVANLAGGMYKAMITTAAGLAVAIPGYLLMAMVNGAIAARGRKMEIAHQVILATLFPKGGDEPRTPHRAIARDEEPPDDSPPEPMLAPPPAPDPGRHGGRA